MRSTSLLVLVAFGATVGCDNAGVQRETSLVSPDDHQVQSLEKADVAGSKPSDTPSFYTVDHYDLEADPGEQLVTTLARAASEQKRVLLQVGGDWCGWCKKMTNFIAENERVHDAISESFLIQKVTYDQKNKNEEFLGGLPEINGYPHLFVFDAKGELLHSQDTAELEKDSGYSEEAFLAFLDHWKPATEPK